ncbi:hypothetical protein RUND412_008214 [Rhizina undulata]
MIGPIFTDHEVGNPAAAISLLDVLGRGHVWKRLEILNLNFPIDEEGLVEFLAHHARTIKSLSLKHCRLLNGMWREILDFLKERLHLTGLALVDLREMLLPGYRTYTYYGHDALGKMEDYVLRGGEPFPPARM